MIAHLSQVSLRFEAQLTQTIQARLTLERDVASLVAPLIADLSTITTEPGSGQDLLEWVRAEIMPSGDVTAFKGESFTDGIDQMPLALETCARSLGHAWVAAALHLPECAERVLRRLEDPLNAWRDEITAYADMRRRGE